MINRSLEGFTANIDTESPPSILTLSSNRQNPSIHNPALKSQTAQPGRPKTKSSKPIPRLKSASEVGSDICNKKRKFICTNEDCGNEYKSSSALGTHKKGCKAKAVYSKENLDEY
jgi:hypothetical protein